ncbi:Protein MCM10-like protein [Smittium mucronatum]|uniref:Protein MCM10-like protein n=1 Tax=Smittium mucronatum TaxID=133383 RepID=A0A1R0H843_9FUNG|nr:Protein MCM10-like protein [Smittium mucronatum]
MIQGKRDWLYQIILKIMILKWTRIATLEQVNQFMKRFENVKLSEIIEQVKEKKQDIAKKAPWSTFVVLKKDPVEIESSKGKKCYRLIATDLSGRDVVILLFSNGSEFISKLKPFYIISVSNPSQEVVFLNVKSQSQILLVGKSRDAIFCKGKLQDDKPCQEMININMSNVCDFHLANAYQVSRRKRNMFLDSTTPHVLQPEKIKKIKLETVQIPFSTLDS